MEPNILFTRTLTVIIVDLDDGSQDYSYTNQLRSVELIGVCEHLRVEALRNLGRMVEDSQTNSSTL